MADLDTLATRLQLIEDKDEIRSLVARYGMIVDNRDIDGLYEVFAPDVCFAGKGASGKLEGADAVVAHYKNRFNLMTVSNHYTHDHVIWFDGDDTAYGIVNAHVEMINQGEPTVGALRYKDIYTRYDGQWRFKERVTGFMYYVDAAKYPAILKEEDRVFITGEQQSADWPEGLESWQKFYNGE